MSYTEQTRKEKKQQHGATLMNEKKLRNESCRVNNPQHASGGEADGLIRFSQLHQSASDKHPQGTKRSFMKHIC